MLTYILWFICKFRFASFFWVCYHFSYIVPLSSLHFSLTLQPPMQKQVGCYSRTEHGRTTRQLGFVPGSEAMRLWGYVLVLAFLGPQLLSQSAGWQSFPLAPGLLSWLGELSFSPGFKPCSAFSSSAEHFWSLYFIGVKLFAVTASFHAENNKLRSLITFLQFSSLIIHRDAYFMSEAAYVHFFFGFLFLFIQEKWVWSKGSFENVNKR